jgi:predicted neutral ceramidase superfamily lipid hydrolase
MQSPPSSQAGDHLGVLYLATQSVNLVGGISAVGLMVYAGMRVGAPAALMLLFPLWVVAPFVAFSLGCLLSGRWSVAVRRIPYLATITVVVCSLVVYAFFALGAARPPAAPFVLTPPVSVVLVTIALTVTALVSRRRRD